MMYGRDLAYIHDVAFGDFAREVAGFVTLLLHEARHTCGLVVDLGCGTGILAKEICAAGFHVVGVDLSPSMIAVAGSRVPEASFHVASLHDFDLPPCVAVCALGEAISYLSPGEARLDTRTLFSRIWNALEPGGLFVFDVIENARPEPMSYRTSRTGPDWALDLVVTEDMDQAIITRTITTRRFAGPHVHTSTETHRVQTFSRVELDSMLTRCGFHVQMDDKYAHVALPPGRVGVIAARPRIEVALRP